MKTKVLFTTVIAVLVTIYPSYAVSIHSEKVLSGIGYTNVDTELNTHVNYANGHAIKVIEEGCGVTNDRMVLNANTENKTAEIHTEISKQYQPIVYNNVSYDEMWSFDVLTKNYIVGSAIDSAYHNATTIKDDSDWTLNNNLTELKSVTEYIGERHFGLNVAKSVRENVLESSEEIVGKFHEERYVIVSNRSKENPTTYNAHTNETFTCP